MEEDTSKAINDEEIEKKVGGLKRKYYEHAYEFGERAWRVYGKKMDLIVWDAGNSWYKVMKVIK